MKPILCLDFDGVCHSYTSGWQGATTISDDAVSGLFEFLEQAALSFDIQVFSTRSLQPGGIDAMKRWFEEQRKRLPPNDDKNYTVIISFPTEKPPATITLDDRAITFNGEWPDIETLKAFQPWYKRKN